MCLFSFCPYPCLVSTCPLPLPICLSVGGFPHVSLVLLRVCLFVQEQQTETMYLNYLGTFSLREIHLTFLFMFFANYHFNFGFCLPSGHSFIPSFFSSILLLCPPHIPSPSSVSPLIASSSKWDAEARNLM